MGKHIRRFMGLFLLGALFTALFSCGNIFGDVEKKRPRAPQDQSSEEPPSGELPPEELPPPAPQTEAIITAGNGQLMLSWEEVEGADAYEIWVGIGDNPDDAEKYGDDITDLAVLVTELINGTEYHFWIKTKNDNGASGFGPMASGTPSEFAVPPETPEELQFYLGNEKITVTWAAVINANVYEIWYGSANDTSAAERYGNDIGLTPAATVSGLNNGEVYYIWVRARNAAGPGDFSSPVAGKPLADASAPTLISGNVQLTANWNAITGAEQYEVFYGTGENPPAMPSYTTSLSTTGIIIGGLTNGQSYNVWIRGRNSTGTGVMSSAANAKPLGTPGAPAIEPVYKAFSVSWEAVPGADEYELYCDTAYPPAALAASTGETSAFINELVNGTIYYARLRAKNANGISDYGPIFSETPGLLPGLYLGNEKIGNYDLPDSLTYISANAANGDEFFIVLGKEELLTPKTLSYSNKNIGITLIGYEKNIEITLSSNGAMFTIGTGVTLSLEENIILLGRPDNTDSLVVVGGSGNSGGKLVMNEGAVICNNDARNGQMGSYYPGGGVTVYGNSFFTMNGGIISGNTALTGGAVLIAGTFTMNGGALSKNTASRGGGVCFPSNHSIGSNGVFTINGGAISGNNAGIGGGVYSYLFGSNTIMTGGRINGNTADSYYNTGGDNNPNLGYGGGVYVYNHGDEFKKEPISGSQTSGIVYGSEALGADDDGIPLKNTATGSGGAVFTGNHGLRNNTADEGDQINSQTGKGLSGSGMPPYGQ